MAWRPGRPRDPRGCFAAFTSHRPCSVRAGTDGKNRRKRQADREADATPLRDGGSRCGRGTQFSAHCGSLRASITAR
jgi:hypothetical protein